MWRKTCSELKFDSVILKDPVAPISHIILVTLDPVVIQSCTEAAGHLSGKRMNNGERREERMTH